MKRILATAIIAAATLVANAFAEPANTANNVSPAEKAKIEAVVHDYLINKPEVLMEALQVLQRKQYEQAEQSIKGTQKSASQFAATLFHQANDPVAGNANGTITVTEFFDYQCPHCVDMAPVIEAIIKKNPNVRVIFKEFPIRGPLSEVASRAALAANIQGKYYQFSHALLQSPQPLTQESIMAVAQKAGLNIEKLKKDMADKVVSDQLAANAKLGQSLKLFGTPAFFIGKTDAKAGTEILYVPGQMNQAQMQDAIDKASK